MEDKNSNIIGLVIKVLVILPILIFGGMVMFSGVHVDPNMHTADVSPETFRDGFIMSTTTWFAIATIVVCALIVVIFFVVLLATDPMRGIKSILGIIAAGVVFALLYAMGTSTTEADLQLAKGVSATQGTIDASTAGIYTAIAALGAGVLAILVGPIINLVRKN